MFFRWSGALTVFIDVAVAATAIINGMVGRYIFMVDWWFFGVM